MNGIFTLNTDLPFDRDNPRTYPERLQIRAPGAVNFLMKGHFIGMFAFLIWNTQTQQLFAARDRFGVKPLNYTQQPDGTLFVSSEIKALVDKKWKTYGIKG